MPDRHPWEDPAWVAALREFARQLGLEDQDLPLLRLALTHSSLSSQAEGDNERLEFLGDSVLTLLVNEHLYRRHPRLPEGRLTRLKQSYVRQATLAEAARLLGLGKLLLLSAGEDSPAARARCSTLSDAFEAVLAAVYLSRGIEEARALVERYILQQNPPGDVVDAKTRLQEFFQEHERLTPTYRTENAGGEAHVPVFISQVLANERILGEGRGGSKKQAEQAAARNALEQLPVRPRSSTVVTRKRSSPRG